jgi:hypothetical protein
MDDETPANKGTRRKGGPARDGRNVYGLAAAGAPHACMAVAVAGRKAKVWPDDGWFWFVLKYS